MQLKFHDQFWYDSKIMRSRVFERYPNIYKDDRGCFLEVLKHNVGLIYTDQWYNDLSWIKQINRSISKSGVVRGMHAQSGNNCQGKFVQAIYGKVFDIITDARPDSKTFGVSDIFELDDKKQNQLWVPRGFLHGFFVPYDQDNASIFEYFCDNEYNKDSELSIKPDGFVQKIFENKLKLDNSFTIDINKLNLSEKDMNGLDYNNWMLEKQLEYEQEGILWYR